MTLPDERYRAVVRTRQLLLNLCNKQHTPRVPKIIREEAAYCLRHYPGDWEMQLAAREAPDVFQERMEPVNRWLQTGLQKNEA